MYCVYRFKDKNNNVIYIGKTNDIKERMYSHFGDCGHLPEECYNSVKVVEYIELDDYVDASMMEKYLIIKLQPIYNTEFISSELLYSPIKNTFTWKEYNFFTNKNRGNHNKHGHYNSSNLRIMEERLANRWTQKYVADKIGATKGTYSNIERGIRLPSYQYIVKIQKLFHMPIDELLEIVK